ncbi:carbohydrate binding domain-containing protein, partial [Streptomyces sp. NPDC051132]|uniref:carbohydrate binding domain-containing protein n=1 Tax=Streptomyces sp. NPDC051132 TaxID=3155667 RepID=UPI00342B909D
MPSTGCRRPTAADRPDRQPRALRTSFTDDFTGWKQIELPFTDFAYRTDYQPVG